MTVLVADTSGLVSLGIVADAETDPLSHCLDVYEVLLPQVVVDELEDVASYEDRHGRAAEAVLDWTSDVTIRSVSLDAEFPLDDGENAAVTLANETGADVLLCDEFNRIGLIHASLAETRLVTTPTLLSVFVRTEACSSRDALELLDQISKERSWEANSYVERARSLLEQP